MTAHLSRPRARLLLIDDLVQVNLTAATTDQVGTAYNVGIGTSVTSRELAETIGDVTDPKMRSGCRRLTQ